VQFDVMDETMVTFARLPWFLNMGGKDRPHAGRRSKYFAAWVEANGCPPRRRDRLTPQTFTRRYAVVEVADTGKNFSQQPVDCDFAYSVVRRVIEWETGGEPRRGEAPAGKAIH
jgi:hypothetical protein